jgi:hypothetical protein
MYAATVLLEYSEYSRRHTPGGSGIFALPPFYACVYMEPNTNGRVNTGLDS